MLRGRPLLALALALALSDALRIETGDDRNGSRHIAVDEGRDYTDDYAGKIQPDGTCKQKMQSDGNGFGYTTSLSVGGFLQKALLDTGSFDPVIEGRDCANCNGATYNSRDSPTFLDKNGERPPPLAKGELTKGAEDAAQNPWFKPIEGIIKGVVQDAKNEDRIAQDANRTETMEYGSGPVLVVPGTDEVVVPGCNLKGPGFPMYEVLDHNIPFLKYSDRMTAIIGMGPYVPEKRTSASTTFSA